jgi:hypothetical protein
LLVLNLYHEADKMIRPFFADRSVIIDGLTINLNRREESFDEGESLTVIFEATFRAFAIGKLCYEVTPKNDKVFNDPKKWHVPPFKNIIDKIAALIDASPVFPQKC